MDATEASATIEAKAAAVLQMLPPGTPAPDVTPGNTITCGWQGGTPEEDGVSVSRDYIMGPTNEALVRRALSTTFEQLSSQGFGVVSDRRNRVSPGIIMNDPRDSFRIGVRGSQDFTRLTVFVSSPCVRPAAP